MAGPTANGGPHPPTAASPAQASHSSATVPRHDRVGPAEPCHPLCRPSWRTPCARATMPTLQRSWRPMRLRRAPLLGEIWPDRLCLPPDQACAHRTHARSRCRTCSCCSTFMQGTCAPPAAGALGPASPACRFGTPSALLPSTQRALLTGRTPASCTGGCPTPSSRWAAPAA